jgi:phage repressor protein C with HTH and peptisase S24 domain
VERLNTILTQWPSADRLARGMGVSPSAFRKWLKGEAEPSRERLVALARTTGVGVAWLAEGTGPEPVFEAVPNGKRRPGGDRPSSAIDWSQFTVPVRTSPAAKAHDEIGLIALHHDWVRSVRGVEPDQLALETVRDESMAPTIKSGDMLLIDTTDRKFRRCGIYLLEVSGERLVKRVQRKHDGSLVLISDNPAYQPDIVDKAFAAELTAIGRVVWAGSAV